MAYLARLSLRPNTVLVDKGTIDFLSSLDVDVPELQGHARFLLPAICPRRAEAAPAAAAWRHEHRNSTDIRSIPGFFGSRISASSMLGHRVDQRRLERARPAKSGAGPNRSMPIWARFGSVPRVRAMTI